MGVFGKGICAGHHGSCPLVQLPKFLASFIQCYPGACQISNHTRGRPLHALEASRAWDVLGQTSGCLPSCYLPNWVKRWERETGRCGYERVAPTKDWTTVYLGMCRFGIHSSSLSSDCAPPPKRPLKNPLLGASGVSTGVKSSPSISWNINTHFTLLHTV